MRQLSDSTGTLTLGQSFEPFGDKLSSSGSATSNYGFTGEWTDGTGLVNLRARYLNTGVGRFMSRDTWEGDYNRPLSLDKWNYVEGNPINFADPSGNCPWCLLTAAVGAFVGAGVYTYNTLSSGNRLEAGDFFTSAAVGAVGGALIGTGAAAIAGVGVFSGLVASTAATVGLVAIGAGSGILGSQVGYTLTAGDSYDTKELLASATVGGVAGAVTGYISGPFSPIISTWGQFGLNVGVSGVAGAAEYAWQSSIAGEEICATDLGVAFGYGLIAGAFGEILAPQTGRFNARYGSLPFESSLYQSSMNSTLRLMIAKEAVYSGIDDVFRSSFVNLFVTKESFLYGN